VIQGKKTYTSVKEHEGEVSCEVVVNHAGDFVGKSAEAKNVGNGFIICNYVGANRRVVCWAVVWGASLKSGRIGGFACAIGGGEIEATAGCCGLGINAWRGFFLVLRIPFFGRFMCPFAVAGLGFRYFVTTSLLRSGHPLRNPFFNSFMRLEIVGLHID
jgi:hypothetical protein